MVRKSFFILICGVLFFSKANAQISTLGIECIAVPFIYEIPVIDGKLDDPIWEKALQLKDFTLTAGESGKTASEQTICYVAADREHLYIAFKCLESDTSGVRANHSIWDHNDIMYDDRVAVYLDVNHDHRSYYELTVNPLGTQMDRSGYLRYPHTRTSEWDLGWNCFWRARTSMNAGYWIAEISIDLESVGLDSVMPGTTLGFNLARVRQPDIQKGEEWAHRKAVFPSEYSALTGVKDGIWETISNFYEPIQFGDMILGNSGIKITELGFKRAGYNWGDVSPPTEFGWNPGTIKIQTGKDIPSGLKLMTCVKADDGRNWELNQPVEADSTGRISFTYFIPSDKENTLTLQLADTLTGDQLYQTSYTLTVPPFIDFNLETLYSRNPAEIRPLQYRMVTDSVILEECDLRLRLISTEKNSVVADVQIEDLKNSRDFSPIFNTDRLRKLEGGNYLIISELTDKISKKSVGHFSQPVTKFELETPEVFMAEQGEYNFGGISDDAIRVKYPDGNEFVFWRAANYGPWWDLDQAALNHEHLESWGAYTQSCCEIMQDRELRYSKVEIIENTPARVVVHWRYALSDSHYKIHMNEWGDEYYRFYPDEIVIREVQLWANSNKEHEFFEAILVKPPGLENLQLYDKPLASLKTLNGRGYSSDQFWANDINFYRDFISSAKDFVFEFNMKDRKHPFAVISLRPDILPGVEPEDINLCSPDKNISKGDHRGHWPCSLYPVDGYNSIGNDRPHHGNIGSIKAMSDKNQNPNSWLMMLGLTNPDSNEKYVHGRGWLYPALCKSNSKGVSVTGYNFAQRAYEIEARDQTDFNLEIDPLDGELLHPVFLISGPGKGPDHLKINGRKIDNTKVLIGRSADGRWVIYLNEKLINKSKISFRF